MALKKYGSSLQTLLSRRFQYAFVDEYQDCSTLQRDVLDALFSGTETIFQKIGDVDQAMLAMKPLFLRGKLWTCDLEILCNHETCLMDDILPQNQSPRGKSLSLGLCFFYPTFSNGITLHRFSSGGSGGSGVLAAVADSMKPPIFSAAPRCISLVMCV